MAKNNNNNKKQVNKQEKLEKNCTLICKRENGYINFVINVDDDLKDIKVRLIRPNVKLASKIYHRVNKD